MEKAALLVNTNYALRSVMDMIWCGHNLEQHPLIKIISSLLKTFKGSRLIMTLTIIWVESF